MKPASCLFGLRFVWAQTAIFSLLHEGKYDNSINNNTYHNNKNNYNITILSFISPIELVNMVGLRQQRKFSIVCTVPHKRSV